MKKFVILFAAMTFAVACGNSTESTEDQTQETGEVKSEVLKREIMEVHDKTMSKMHMLSMLEKDLKERAKTAEGDTAAFHNARMDVKMAHSDMMEWMHNFKNPDEMEVSEEEKVEYLAAEKEKVLQLEEYTARSIDNAKLVISGERPN